MTSAAPTSTAFPNLTGHQFMSLTTFRKSGEPVATPVWFAQAGDRLYVVSLSTAYKLKRIAHNPAVIVAPCTMNGRVLGDSASGTARILSEAEGKIADAALQKKYGIQKILFAFLWKLQRGTPVFIEILPA